MGAHIHYPISISGERAELLFARFGKLVHNYTKGLQDSMSVGDECPSCKETVVFSSEVLEYLMSCECMDNTLLQLDLSDAFHHDIAKELPPKDNSCPPRFSKSNIPCNNDTISYNTWKQSTFAIPAKYSCFLPTSELPFAWLPMIPESPDE